MFRVIEGGLGGATVVRGPAGAEDIAREASRRLKAAGYDDAMARSFVTGCGIPEGLKYFKLQVDYAVAALTRRSPTPVDFRDDKYWPSY